MKKSEFFDFITSVPKAEIHLHSEAVVSTKTIGTLYKKHFDKEMTKQELDNLFVFSNLTEFVQAFITLQKLFNTPEDFVLLFDDIENYLKENNIVYSELFFSPSSFIRKGFAFDEMIAVFDKCINAIKKRSGIEIKILVDVSRTFGLENAMNNLNYILANGSKNIVGIGLGGDEVHNPAEIYEPVFAKAKQAGLHVVAHAGEDVGPESVWSTLSALKAERIGHGITSIQDEKLMQELAAKKIPLEICVTSNVFTKKLVTEAKDHPVKKFFDKNIIVTVNTDDPAFFNTSLVNEYWILHKELGFSMDEIKTLILNGFDAAFCSKQKKTAYKKAVEEAWLKKTAE